MLRVSLECIDDAVSLKSYIIFPEMLSTRELIKWFGNNSEVLSLWLKSRRRRKRHIRTSSVLPIIKGHAISRNGTELVRNIPQDSKTRNDHFNN